ncbi:hypothetical protein OG21DRAFT_1484695 [Imleria badia]|nr:hypothetical protein OG21DRAFT_1484695 [Imleria badia]
MRKGDPNRTDSLTQSIRLLKAQRMAGGALPELRETNSLVEEFILLANVSVAKKIDEVFPLY